MTEKIHCEGKNCEECIEVCYKQTNPSPTKDEKNTKEILVKFKDGYCLVLENDELSLREDIYTSYRICVGEKTEEMYEWIKNLYKQNASKISKLNEQGAEIVKLWIENDILKQTLNKIQTLTKEV